jgi:hypothetical protein
MGLDLGSMFFYFQKLIFDDSKAQRFLTMAPRLWWTAMTEGRPYSSEG